MPNQVIPNDICDDEYLGRIILHSYHYSESKKKVRPEAFMPSPNEQDEVSTLRYGYTNIDFCKERGLLIAERRSVSSPCKFIGVALIRCDKVINAPNNQLDKNEDPKEHLDFEASPVFTPLSANEELREERPIYTEDDGVPAHADIKYNVNVFEEHKPMKQKFKQRVLKPLVIMAKKNFFKDRDTSSNIWIGEDINLVD